MGAKPSKKPCRFAAPFSKSPQKKDEGKRHGENGRNCKEGKEMDGHWALSSGQVHCTCTSVPLPKLLGFLCRNLQPQ
jgi:hypothetical protein